MRSDVQAAALKAAVKVAFSVAMVGGCSAPPGEARAPATDDSELSSSAPARCHDAGRADGAALDAAVPDAATDAGAPDCDAAIAAAFPVVGDYPGEARAVSDEVVACCEQRLRESHGVIAHRWDCCANVPKTDQEVSLACTPWGPPVPPAMPAGFAFEVA